MSPLTIQIMLAFHCSKEPMQWFPAEQWDSQPAKQSRRFLVDQGLIEDGGGGSFCATEKGSAWVKFICATPLPRVEWVLSTSRDVAA